MLGLGEILGTVGVITFANGRKQREALVHPHNGSPGPYLLTLCGINSKLESLWLMRHQQTWHKWGFEKNSCLGLVLLGCFPHMTQFSFPEGERVQGERSPVVSYLVEPSSRHLQLHANMYMRTGETCRKPPSQHTVKDN